MATEEGDVFGETAFLIDGNDGEGSSSAGFPVDRDVFRICLSEALEGTFPIVRARSGNLDQVGVPGILRDSEIVIALFLHSKWLARWMSRGELTGEAIPSLFLDRRRVLHSRSGRKQSWEGGHKTPTIFRSSHEATSHLGACNRRCRRYSKGEHQWESSSPRQTKERREAGERCGGGAETVETLHSSVS
jgi:hypothetical protein